MAAPSLLDRPPARRDQHRGRPTPIKRGSRAANGRDATRGPQRGLRAAARADDGKHEPAAKRAHGGGSEATDALQQLYSRPRASGATWATCWRRNWRTRCTICSTISGSAISSAISSATNTEGDHARGPILHATGSDQQRPRRSDPRPAERSAPAPAISGSGLPYLLLAYHPDARTH